MCHARQSKHDNCMKHEENSCQKLSKLEVHDLQIELPLAINTTVTTCILINTAKERMSYSSFF